MGLGRREQELSLGIEFLGTREVPGLGDILAWDSPSRHTPHPLPDLSGRWGKGKGEEWLCLISPGFLCRKVHRGVCVQRGSPTWPALSVNRSLRGA